VLGNLLDLADFDYQNSEAVRDELRGRVGDSRASHTRVAGAVLQPVTGFGLERIGDVPLYAVDALVRRSAALQAMTDGADAVVRINATVAARLGLKDGLNDQVQVSQEGATVKLPLVIDARVPDGGVWIASARPGSAQLGENFGTVELKPA
jgi:NADH-quinone oxidoreductase subunit G